MKKAQIQLVLSVVVFTVLLLGGLGFWFIGVYNGLVTADNDVDGAKAQVEVVLQRRLDLIPNLVNTVKGYADHEKQTLTAVLEARAAAQDTLDRIMSKKNVTKNDVETLVASEKALGGVLDRLFALVENYPDLKANSNFLALQDQLEGTENRIAVQRMRYNDSVRVYNTKIQAFPGNIASALLSFEERGYFDAADRANTPPEVNF